MKRLSPNSKHLMMTLSDTQWDALQARAKARDVSPQDCLRLILDEYLAEASRAEDTPLGRASRDIHTALAILEREIRPAPRRRSAA